MTLRRSWGVLEAMAARWRSRRERRAAEQAVALAHARAAAFEVLERVVEPFVRAGEANVVRSEGDATVEPRNPRAAAIWLQPDPHYHSLCVGPYGNLHEIFDDAELEQCLRAIVDGRYSEEVTADKRRLTMTFHLPDAADIRVRHVGIGGDLGYGEPGLRRYAPYSEGARTSDLIT